MAWRARLAEYYVEYGLDPEVRPPAADRRPFDNDFCAIVEEFKSEVVSFYFGLPYKCLFDRVKATGAKIIAAATTVAKARWLEAHGCDAVIAMGVEAGGHRGNFLTQDYAAQVGTFALVPQVVDAVSVPVIAAGGITDARGIVAALTLGASAVQMGTAYLFCPEAKVPEVHRIALRESQDDSTVLTNIFTGRPARGIINRAVRELGPLSTVASAFPLQLPIFFGEFETKQDICKPYQSSPDNDIARRRIIGSGQIATQLGKFDGITCKGLGG